MVINGSSSTACYGFPVTPCIFIYILYTYTDMKEDQATSISHIITYSKII